jgi:hypothetical protein
VLAGCGPDFEALFHAGDAADAAADASQDDGGDSGGSKPGSDGGCPELSCVPLLLCVFGACNYSCQGCGCHCEAAVCPQLGGRSCAATCGQDTKCQVSCAQPPGAPDATCNFVAHGARSAAYTCGATSNACNATCDEGSSCALACDQSNGSCAMTCSDTASCLLTCNGVQNCSLDCASGPAHDCPNGTKTCNRSCP